MKPPKILAVASAADLSYRYGCTPAWWQLWKGLYEVGVDLIVTPYRGRPVATPWWRTSDNPTRREGEAYAAARALVARAKGDTLLRRGENDDVESKSDRVTRHAIMRLITPRWQKHIGQILDRERDVDAVIFFTVPMSHFRGIPQFIRDRYDIPVVFYDGDVPFSLPEFGGTDTGFNYYHGADPAEYDLVICNSTGGVQRLYELGARRAEPLMWGADPEFFSPRSVEKSCDVFFYAHGDKYRRDWIETLVGRPSLALPELNFALGGEDFRADIGQARLIGGVPFNRFADAISAARINLNIVRRAHSSVSGSSSSRPFELAACGAAIVSNPWNGLDQWFTLDEEVLVVANQDEAIAAYRLLLADPGLAQAMGARARKRVLDEHTYTHRAKQLLQLLGIPSGPLVGA